MLDYTVESKIMKKQMCKKKKDHNIRLKQEAKLSLG